ncbi:hypothetical protein GE21DRAFT_9275 [Neurospora crassa]|uniref:Alpha/beta-hydrolase n=1 Tax=Neurospora crassa (strain ATCC 24698 / 74-OR23-1A / CBS 708.71 / DSM 1257 / FGSC 987) TaxID=367110 RepID=Q7RZF4_NEUCR|nr:hypothetical protein NCU04064 [Neurospora crassa OR74A]EAA28443.2 hypothetical protein NCU04064 [Neurospora crassa OR74A]KHE81862.1 hypothetical protein GE21DRAFT_9275 [Neurospora crassa]|eukprot:XP_957679.2 hypothetical protein NCU04064 [Neurospora crassa OR74A]
MSRWTLALRLRRITVALPKFSHQASHRRFYSSSPPFEPSIERYTVPCASSGEITVSLYNVADRPPTDPLIIWIPPFAARDETDPNYQLPSWLHTYSAAVIHYRWSGLYDDRPQPKLKPKIEEPDFDDEGYQSSETPNSKEEERLPKEEEEDISITPLHWPTPIHDVLFGYSWIIQNLQPRYPKRKDVYICGSYLGASLAAGLALTESYPHARMAVRGLLAYNGIYDWTTFLPDHPIHRPKGDDRILIEEQLHKLNRDLDKDAGPAATSPIIAHYQRRLEDLFGSPSGLFDSFASACLFFHTAGLFVPTTFDEKYVPEWLFPPPPGPLITGAGTGANGVSSGDINVPADVPSEPHDPLTSPSTPPPHQPPAPSPLPASQNPTDDLDPDNSEHSEHYRMHMSMINDAEGEPDEVAAEDMLQQTLKVEILPGKFPRKSYVHFPPRHSMLKLPDTLLLYETPSAELPFKCDALAKIGSSEGGKDDGVVDAAARNRNQKGLSGVQKQKQKKIKGEEEEEEEEGQGEKYEEGDSAQGEAEEKKKPRPRLKTRKHRKPPVAITAGENSFRTQAYELALLMQRSIEMLELKERRKWDEDYLIDLHHWELEAARRVKVADVGVVDDQDMAIGDLEGVGDLDERGREIVLGWLEEKMDKAR